MRRPEGFISAQAAIRKYEVAFGGAAALKARIAEYLRDGRLPAKCAYSWTVKTTDFREGRKQDPKVNGVEYDNIPSRAWRKSGLRTNDYVAAWLWGPGLFFASGDYRNKSISYYKDVHFDLERLQKLLDPKIAPSRAGIGGPKFQKEKWDRFFLYVIREAHNGSFTSQKYGSPTDLAKRASAALDGPTENTLLPMCQHIWRLLVEPEYSHGPVTGGLELPEPDDDA